MRGSFVALLLLLSSCRAASGSDTIAASDAGAASDDGGPKVYAEPPVVEPVGDVLVETWAGSGARGSVDGAATEAQFDNPVGVAIEPSGDVLVTEYDGAQLRRIDKDRVTTTVARGLQDAFGLLVLPDSILVQTDKNATGQKNATTGTLWRVVGGVAEVMITGLSRPRGLTRLLDGRVALADRDRNLLYTFDMTTRSLEPLAGSGLAGLFDGAASVAQFDQPYGLATLPDGSIVVADRGNHCIRRVALNGDVSRFAGDGIAGIRDSDDRLNARFDWPIDLATDTVGNVYVSDEGNRRIRVITTAGAVRTIAGDGVQGYADGPGLSARFFAQEQIAVTPDGKTIYVADGNKGLPDPAFHRVRRITIR
jgi:DNA-binding beta-propeller fold protein YncE